MLYPLKRGLVEEDDKLMDKYEFLLLRSKEIWEESIAGGGYKKKDKEGEAIMYKPAPPGAGGLPSSIVQATGVPSNKPSSSSSSRKTQNSFNKA